MREKAGGSAETENWVRGSPVNQAGGGWKDGSFGEDGSVLSEGKKKNKQLENKCLLQRDGGRALLLIEGTPLEEQGTSSPNNRSERSCDFTAHFGS